MVAVALRGGGRARGAERARERGDVAGAGDPARGTDDRARPAAADRGRADAAAGRPPALEAPNDIVFDAAGGFYFTDSGHWRDRVKQSGAIYYAQPDGSRIVAAIDSFPAPNGVGLSPDGGRLYVSSTQAGRLWYWVVESPGVLRGGKTFFAPGEANFLWSPATYALLDSLAIDAEGNVCQANILSGISVLSPSGDLLEHLPIDDPFTTNICFADPDRRTAFVTGAGHGKVFEMEWPRPGAALNFEHT